jgi:hypothetical protein
MDNCYVYALIDPINRAPFYFGKGKDDRSQVHGRPKDNHNKQKLHIIHTLQSLGLEHQVKYISINMSSSDALQLEDFCIEQWKKTYKNYPLCNKTRNPPPDRTGCKNTLETKMKRSLSNKGQIPWIKGRTIENGGLPKDHGNKIKIGMKNSSLNFTDL